MVADHRRQGTVPQDERLLPGPWDVSVEKNLKKHLEKLKSSLGDFEKALNEDRAQVILCCMPGCPSGSFGIFECFLTWRLLAYGVCLNLQTVKRLMNQLDAARVAELLINVPKELREGRMQQKALDGQPLYEFTPPKTFQVEYNPRSNKDLATEGRFSAKDQEAAVIAALQCHIGNKHFTPNLQEKINCRNSFFICVARMVRTLCTQ